MILGGWIIVAGGMIVRGHGGTIVAYPHREVAENAAKMPEVAGQAARQGGPAAVAAVEIRLVTTDMEGADRGGNHG